MLHHTIYRHLESKEWVTFIHGAGGSSTVWFKQIKDYQEKYNVLLIDLRGHGQSKDILAVFNKKYTFDNIAYDVIHVLEHLNVSSSHFVGISLGTIVIRKIAELRPSMVNTMIMGGAILKLNISSRILMFLGNAFKSILPYMWLYRIMAFVIMPKDNHKESRNRFINEAKKLYQREFKRWLKLTSEINPLLRIFRENETGIPTLYIMGDEDTMFLSSVRKVVKEHPKSDLHIISNCGHVVNIDQPSIFNRISLDFISSQTHP